MFTGIVETMGRVLALDRDGEMARIRIEAPSLAAEVELGDSVAVNGACLTVCQSDAESISFDAVRETLQRTNLGDLDRDSHVNLERAMRTDGRLDGHIVQGHVDGVGRLRELRRRGEDVQLFVDCPEEIASLLVEKGSVAIDGVSLTVVGVEDRGFDVALIPHTLRETNLGERRPGDRLNLEADILGKSVKRYLERISPAQ